METGGTQTGPMQVKQGSVRKISFSLCPSCVQIRLIDLETGRFVLGLWPIIPKTYVKRLYIWVCIYMWDNDQHNVVGAN